MAGLLSEAAGISTKDFYIPSRLLCQVSEEMGQPLFLFFFFFFSLYVDAHMQPNIIAYAAQPCCA